MMNAAVNTSGLTAAQTGLACVTPPCPQCYPTAMGPAGKQAARRCTAAPRVPHHTSLGLLEVGDDFNSSCTSKFSMEMLGRQLAQLNPHASSRKAVAARSHKAGRACDDSKETRSAPCPILLQAQSSLYAQRKGR